MHIGIGVGIGFKHMHNNVVAVVDTTAPTAPTGLTATAASSSQINLSWTAATDNVGVTGYIVFRGGVQIATTTSTSYSDTGLTASTAYSYTVEARDAAGNVSAASTSASATTQAAPATNHALSLNGTSDYLTVPSMTFDQIVLDFTGQQANGKYYLDARPGVANAYFLRNSSGVDITSASSPFANGIYLNGSLISYSTTGVIPTNQRMTLKFVFSAAGTGAVSLYSQNGNSNPMSVTVYDVKFYNAGVLIAHYDMNTQTVNDQTGNGHNATLTGGTWVTY